MMLHRIARILLGLALWIGLSVWCILLLTAEREGHGSTFADLESHFLRREIGLIVRFPKRVFFAVGDAVRLEGSDRRLIGEVSALLDDRDRPRSERYEWGRAVRIKLHDRRSPGLRRDARARVARDPGSFVSVANKLLPPEKRRVVIEEWKRAWHRHRGQIIERLTPVISGLIEDVETTARAELRPFLDRHWDEIDRLLRKAEGKLDVEQLTEVFEDEVWPIMRKHLQPVTDAIGKEVWERFPLWGLSWRLAYQSLPMTRNDHLERRWQLFMKKEVTPVLKSRVPDLFDASRKIAKESLRNPRVTSTLSDVLHRLLGDPEFHQLVNVFAREVFLDNPDFRATLERRWKSEEMRGSLEFVSERLEITIRSIGEILMGTRESGITPEFAQVLRAQILWKDRRWIVVDPGSDGAPFLEEGATLIAEVQDGR